MISPKGFGLLKSYFANCSLIAFAEISLMASSFEKVSNIFSERFAIANNSFLIVLYRIFYIFFD
jgi:hypothetical protein